MIDPNSNKNRLTQPTSFGEPLIVDLLKTLGVGIGVIGFFLVVGALLGLAIIAPWGRASFDCSMWCVIERDIREFLGVLWS